MNRATGEEIADYFDSLPRAAGTAEERVVTTARHFKMKPAGVHRHLKFWWPGKKYQEEFGPKKSRIKWDRPTGEILKALNQHGSVSNAAKALGTTAVTLTKAMDRHHIVQLWMVGESNGQAKVSGAARGRPRRRPEARHVWTGAESNGRERN